MKRDITKRKLNKRIFDTKIRQGKIVERTTDRGTKIWVHKPSGIILSDLQRLPREDYIRVSSYLQKVWIQENKLTSIDVIMISKQVSYPNICKMLNLEMMLCSRDVDEVCTPFFREDPKKTPVADVYRWKGFDMKGWYAMNDCEVYDSLEELVDAKGEHIHDIIGEVCGDTLEQPHFYYYQYNEFFDREIVGVERLHKSMLVHDGKIYRIVLINKND